MIDLLHRISSYCRAALACLVVVAAIGLGPPASAAAPGGFLVFDRVGGMPGKPDLSAYGLGTNIIGIPNSVVFYSDWTINTASLQSYVSSLPLNTIIELDFEGGPWQYRKSVDQVQTDWTKQKITEVINTIHATPGRSDIKVGVYATIARTYWEPTQYHVNPTNATNIANFITWQNDNTYMHSPPNNISDVVDLHFPSLYTAYGNAGFENDKWWEVAATYNIAEMARVGGGKPIYPYIWPVYHNSNTKLTPAYIPGASWRRQLEFLRDPTQHVTLTAPAGGQTLPQNTVLSGAVIWHYAFGLHSWADYGTPASWWKVTQQFMDPGTPNTSGYNNDWLDEGNIGGATQYASNGDAWNWAESVTFNGTLVTAPSGWRMHVSNAVAGVHQHFFITTDTSVVPVGAKFYTYVYLDPANPPSEIMLQFYGPGWEHRAYWGSDSIAWGTNGTNSRRYMGALPAAGQWVRLEVPASQVGMQNQPLGGMAFTLFNGRVAWDKSGFTGGPDSVDFRSIDYQTLGNWKTTARYGNTGRHIIYPGLIPNYPSYASVTMFGASTSAWSASLDDSTPWALQSETYSVANPQRIAGRWHSPTNFTVDVSINDGKTHKVTFYVLDYDNQDRKQKIEMLDASDNVLASVVVEKFYHGTITGDTAPREPKYYSFDVSGHVKFKVTHLGPAGSDAVVSGIFFDEL